MRTLSALSVVTDPFGGYTVDLLRELFDRVVPYKEHFVADLSLPLEEFTSSRHREHGRRALKRVSVEICTDPSSHLEEWISLYDQLCQRHAIGGLRQFSREGFAVQLTTPGLIMFRAYDSTGPLCLDLWFIHGDVAHAHLVGISPRGYDLQVSYGMKLFILQYLAGKVRWANLGAIPGVTSANHSGLAHFKSGWSSGTRTAYFCGKIFNATAYKDLVRESRVQTDTFFPAYRSGEFD
jgi:hypothetical protein